MHILLGLINFFFSHKSVWCKTWTSRYNVAVVFLNSQQLRLPVQNLPKIGLSAPVMEGENLLGPHSFLRIYMQLRLMRQVDGRSIDKTLHMPVDKS